ncbi:MAG: S9 family peptidase [Burkholderiales bacterium]|nr:S9 family peptidase [Burkholderiales bacterium]
MTSRPASILCLRAAAGLRTVGAVAALTAVTACAVHAAPADAPAAAAWPPPIRAYFGPAQIEKASLSQSGRWLAYTAPAGQGRNGLLVIDLDAPQQITAAAHFADADIGSFHWVGDDRLVFSVAEPRTADADLRFYPGLFSVRRDGRERRELVSTQAETFVTGTLSSSRKLSPLHMLLDVPGQGSGHVVVGAMHEDALGDLDRVSPLRLDVVTGEAESLALGAPEHAQSWLFGPRGTPRLALAFHGGRTRIYWHAADPDGWRLIGDFENEHERWWPQQLVGADELYVTHGEGAAQDAVLARLDLDTGRPVEPALVSTPGFDFDGRLLTAYDGGPVLGVRTTTDAETTVWFSPAMKAVQTEIDRRLPGRINRLSCRRCGEPGMTVLVKSWSDIEPGEYWVWRGAPALWRRVGRVRPAIDPRRMAKLDFRRIQARDGADLPLWITRPTDPAAGHPLPAVILVHGGPWVRGSSWAFEPEAQFLASRGYLVIEPEVRGSTGYGYAHFRAGWKQYGEGMIDDLADAARWAVAHAGADPKRLCVMGASYGGYAVLMSLVRHPHLYRCGVAAAAVTDPRLWMKWSASSDVSQEARRYDLRTLIGDPATDAAMFDRISPVLQAARIQAPLLLAFGGADRRVPIEQGTRLRDALQAAGHDPQWVVYPGEGHGWSDPDDVDDYYRRVEAFLASELR